MLLLLACTDSKESALESDAPPTSYLVDWSTQPSPPVAGAEAVFTETITDENGEPVEDLQQSHKRTVHTLFISSDLVDFQHLHQEDFTPLTADNLRTATFSFPVTLAYSGSYGLSFDYAHRNQYLHTEASLEVAGNLPQGTPSPDLSTSVTVGTITASISWEVPAIAGFEASWIITLSDESGSITDVTPYLGADAHAVITDTSLSSISHTHAWVPGMENLPPGHEMPHTWSGPTIPFHYTFLQPGTYKMWVQFARTSTGADTAYTLPLWFEVSP